MNKENFNNLLNDLYDKYNPAKKSDVENLLNQYNGKEFDCIKFFFMKYNFRASANYDPKIGTDKHVKSLIDKYSIGERGIAEDSDNKPNEIEHAINEVKNKTSEITEFAKKEINSSIEEINSSMKTKSEDIDKLITDFQKTRSQIEQLVKEKIIELDNIFAEKMTLLSNISKDNKPSNISIKINQNFDGILELPEEISNLSVGSRILLVDSNGMMVGIEIKDVFIDCVSVAGKCIKEITIDKI